MVQYSSEGQRLLTVQVDRDGSLAKTAARLGWRRQQVHAYASGTREPGIRPAAQMRDVLDIPMGAWAIPARCPSTDTPTDIPTDTEPATSAA